MAYLRVIELGIICCLSGNDLLPARPQTVTRSNYNLFSELDPLPFHVKLYRQQNIPAGWRRNDNAIITSKRRRNVVLTYL